MTRSLMTLPRDPLLKLATLENSSPSLRMPALLGTVAILVLFLALGLWSVLAPLASATLAVGTVVVESDRKVVQHLEGGVVRTISVHDGDHVMAGDVLIQLDETRLVSAIQTLRPLLAINITQRARLEAERKSATSIVFPISQDELTLGDFKSIEDDQDSNFRARGLALTNRIRTLESERRQLQVTLTGLRQQIEIHDYRLGLETKDLSVAVELANSRVGTEQRVRELAKSFAGLQGERAALLTRTTETELKIEHTKLEVDHVQTSFLESVEMELQQNHREHLDLIDRFRNTSDELRRTRIEAPVAGRIVNLVIHTIGGVIGPGMALLEIVPDNDRLLIEAQIRPTDIEAVAPGMPVRVRVNGSDARHRPLFTGTVLSVSADRITDRQRANAYFLVRIVLNHDQIGRFKQDDLRPGMGVEIMITKGEKAVIEYLISPLMSFFANAMHE